jgi:CO/xanthine dehydrogenase Mo-binding subunit
MSAAGTTVQLPASLKDNPRLSQWLRLERDGTVSILPGKVELGQGIVTALAQIAAEELDVAFERIRMVPAATPSSPNEGVTSGSLSIQDSGSALHLACAEARALLLERAARQLGVPAAELDVSDGQISHQSGASTSYWAMADAGEGTLEREATGSAAPKPHARYRIVGTNVPRLDIPRKAAAQAGFIQDLVWPGMLFGRVVRPPRHGAALVSCDQEKVASMPGVVAVVRDGSFLGVVAEREEEAIRAATALAGVCVWQGGTPFPEPHKLQDFLVQRASKTTVLSEKSGPAAGKGSKVLEAAYTKPFISHASIGPSCAVAQFDSAASLHVWTNSQGVYNLRRDVALALTMPVESVSVQHVEGAGCYGHNGADDVALDAALLARAVPGRHVKLQWMRADEFAWAPYGPAMRVQLHAALDASGRIVDWLHEFWSSGHSSRPGRGAMPTLLAANYLEKPFARLPAIDMAMPAGGGGRNSIPLYEFPNQRVVNHYIEAMPVRTSALRSLGAYANVFAIESFMDELADAADADPVEFRLRHLSDPRGRAVIEAAARNSGWRDRGRIGTGEPARGMGIAFAKYKNLGAYCAVVAEIEAEVEVRVKRLWIAVDVGLVVNPDGVVNQIEGGAIQAASWTLKEEVKFTAEGIACQGWEDYPILTFSEVPAVQVEIIGRPDHNSVGAGEAPMGPTAAAIANAVHAALGVRVRDLPLTPERVAAAMG